MVFHLARVYAQKLFRLCIKCNVFWKASVNLMGIMWSEDDIEKIICLFLRYFATS